MHRPSPNAEAFYFRLFCIAFFDGLRLDALAILFFLCYTIKKNREGGEEMTPNIKTPRRVSEAVGFSLLLAMAMLFGFSVLTGGAEERTPLFLLLEIALKLLVFLVPSAFVLLFFGRAKIAFPMMDERASLNKNLMLILSSFGVIVILQMLYAAVFPTAMQTVGIERGRPFSEDLLLFLLYAVVPAAAEEIFFRFVILRSMRVFRTSLAILMSALVFGLFHFSAPFFPIAFVGGLILGMAYVSTGAIRSVIGIHFLCNAFWFLAETVNVCLPDAHAFFMRSAFSVCVLLSSAGLPFLKENMIAFFADDEYAVPSSMVFSLSMILFIVLSVVIQLLL